MGEGLVTEFSDRLPRPRHTVRIRPVDEHTTIRIDSAGDIRIVTVCMETTEGPYEIAVWQDGDVARRIARAIAPGIVGEGG